RQAGDAVGLHAGAGDDRARLHGPVVGRHRDAAARGPYALHLHARPDLAARPREQRGEAARYRGEVDDGSARRVDRLQARRVRLDLLQARGVDELEPRHPVRLPALEQRLEAGELGLVGGDDDLADLLVGQPVLAAEVAHQADTGHAQAGAQRARAVVDAGMDDAGGVARLEPCDLGLLLGHRDPEARPARGEGACRGQPDDAGPDHDDVGAVHGRQDTTPRVGPRRYRERDRAGRLRYDPARDLAAGSTQGRLAGTP